MLIEPTIGKKDFQILKLYSEGKNVEEIRKAVGYKQEKSVYNKLNKYKKRGVIR